MDLDFNKIFKTALKSNNGLYKKFIYYFCKHYFYCDIHPNNNISDRVEFAHNALGVVINKDAIIEENVVIHHHVTLGRNDSGVPHICEGVLLGAYAIVLGNVVIGRGVKIGAGCVVTKDVLPGCTVVGNPMRIIEENRDSKMNL